MADKYSKVCFIECGSYGIVYKVKSLRNEKELYALKLYSRGVEYATVRELSCLAALRGHPNVIEMLDCFIYEGTVALLMPYVPYTLSQIIHNGYGLQIRNDTGHSVQLIPLSFVAHFSTQVATALSYMHTLNIVHRDLTPANVLLTEDLTVKVADMSLSRLCSKQMSPTVVTKHYRAPEVFENGFSKYTCAVDTWSLGVMIADATEGRMVFLPRMIYGQILSTYQIIGRTLCPKDHPLASSFEPWDPAAVMPNVMACKLVKRIVMRLLAFRESERLMAHELLRDPEWIRVAQMTEDEKALVRNDIRQKQM